MDGDDYMHLQFWLQGPEGTPYGQNLSKGGYWFKISVKLTSEYPMSPPKVSFRKPAFF
jgi:ubiquitin-protein ligase